MESYRKELWFHIPGRRAFINITPQVEQCLKESGITEGPVLSNAMHITGRSSLTVTNQACTMTKNSDWKNLPPMHRYHNTATMWREDNADAHIKRQIMGREVVVGVTNGKLDFGP